VIQNETFYGIFVCLSFFCEGGHFVLAPTIYAKLFGPEGGIRVYSVGFCFIGLASFVNIFLMELLLENIDFSGLSFLYGVLSLIALLILCFVFKEQKV